MKSVLLLVDARDWAFDHIADHMKQALKDDYHVTTLYVEDYNRRQDDLIYDVISSGCDACFIFWRFLIAQFLNPVHINNIVNKYGINAVEYAEKISGINFLTAVYDHLFEEECTSELHDAIYNILVSDYYVCSMLLKSLYVSKENFLHPLMVIQDVVDLDKFRPNHYSGNVIKDKVIIGWAGNSTWGNHRETKDHKGVETILKPVVNELIEQGYPVELNCADRNYEKIAFDQMPSYYESIDIYVCVSSSEGTPNTVLEAMAVGLPVVSTRVGIVPELFGVLQSAFILEDRTQENLREKLISLIDNADLRNQLSNENKQIIKAWNLEGQAVKFRAFFNLAISNASKRTELEKSLKKGRLQSLIIKRYSELYNNLEKKSVKEKEIINNLKTRISKLQERNMRNQVKLFEQKGNTKLQGELYRANTDTKPSKSAYSWTAFIMKKTYNLFYDMKLYKLNRLIKKIGYDLWNIDQ
jgi:glycosyltransferase involved in cell wall biosynthesis